MCPTESTSMHAAINRLPSELLSKIFLICAASWPVIDLSHFLTQSSEEIVEGNFRCGNCLPWIAITQVCRYWRSVALECGELWSALLFSSQEATNEVIRRSKGANLIVKATSGPHGKAVTVFEIVSTMLHRVSVLHLRYSADDLHSLLHSIQSVAAPNLESLRLSANINSSYYPPFNMPNVIFAGHTPSLRVLELTHCTFSWNSLPLSGLTHLEIRNATTPPTIAQILTFLRGVPMLDTLILDGVLPTHQLNDASRGVVSSRQILSKLRTLTLAGSVDSCTSILEQIAYPTEAIVTLNCMITPNEITNVSNMLQGAYSAVELGGGRHTINSLAIAQTFQPHLVLKCFLVRCSSSPTDISEQIPQLCISLSKGGFLINRTFEEAMHAVVHAALPTLPLAGVQHFIVGGQPMIDWREFLPHLSQIHTIHFHEVFPTELMVVLMKGGEKPMESAEPITPLLPHLWGLWLRGVDFEWPDRLRSLLEWLQFRVHIGSAIRNLHLTKCWSLFERDVERVKEFVENVDWDEVEEIYSDGYQETGADFEGIYDSD